MIQLLTELHTLDAMNSVLVRGMCTPLAHADEMAKSSG